MPFQMNYTILRMENNTLNKIIQKKYKNCLDKKEYNIIINPLLMIEV